MIIWLVSLLPNSNFAARQNSSKSVFEKIRKTVIIDSFIKTVRSISEKIKNKDNFKFGNSTVTSKF